MSLKGGLHGRVRPRIRPPGVVCVSHGGEAILFFMAAVVEVEAAMAMETGLFLRVEAHRHVWGGEQKLL